MGTTDGPFPGIIQIQMSKRENEEYAWVSSKFSDTSIQHYATFTTAHTRILREAQKKVRYFSAQLKSLLKQGHSNLVAASAYLTSGGKFHGLTTWPGAASSGALLEQTE
jgi:hypothetical protein